VTSCIAALEAQAAGCPVIASKRGALVESIKDGETGLLIEGDPYSKEFQDKFVNETIKLLKDKARLDKMRVESIKYIKNNFTWELIAKEWTEKFKDMIK